MRNPTWGWAAHRPDDDTGAGATGDDDSSGGGQDTGQNDAPGGTAKADLSPEQLRDQLTQANREAAKSRKERKTLEDRIQALEGEKLSDQDKLERRATDAEQGLTAAQATIKTLQVRLAVAELAGTVGIVDAEAAVALLDTSAVTFGDDGVPDRKEIEQELRDLAKRKPYLVRHGSAGGGDGNSDTGGDVVDMNALIRRGAGVRAS